MTDLAPDPSAISARTPHWRAERPVSSLRIREVNVDLRKRYGNALGVEGTFQDRMGAVDGVTVAHADRETGGTGEGTGSQNSRTGRGTTG